LVLLNWLLQHGDTGLLHGWEVWTHGHVAGTAPGSAL